LELEEFRDSREEDLDRLHSGVVGFSKVLVVRVRDLLGDTLVVVPRGRVEVLRGSFSPVAGFKQLFNSREPVLRNPESPEIEDPLVLGLIKPLGLGLSPVELCLERGLGLSEGSAGFEVLFLRGRVPYNESFVLPPGSAELGLLFFSIVETFSEDLEETGPFFNVPFFLAPIDLGGARPEEAGLPGAEPGLASLLTGAARRDVGFLRDNPLGFIAGLGGGIGSSSSSSTGSSSGDSLLVCWASSKN